jgi:hypothetical protein
VHHDSVVVRAARPGPLYRVLGHHALFSML